MVDTVKNERCIGCKAATYAMNMEGPVDSSVLVLSGRPNIDERALWIDPVYDEFKADFLTEIGWDWTQLRRGYLVRCSRLFGQRPEVQEVQQCARYFLQPELEQNQPAIVVLMGDVACQLFPQIELTIQRGLPLYCEGDESVLRNLQWHGWVVPMHHPMQGRLRQEGRQEIVQDWVRLKWWLNDGEWQWDLDQDRTYQMWLEAHGKGLSIEIKGEKYSSTDMYHYLKMKPSERQLFHQFKQVFGGKIKWKESGR